MVETPSNIYDEYFNLTEKYKKMYNGRVVVLLQVGAFFEIYGIKIKESDDIIGSSIENISEVCQLNISEKKISYRNGNIVMAGFRDYTLDKYILKLTEYGYTIPVYIQEKNGKTVTRVLEHVYSPGTLISCDTDSSPVMTNNIMSIWMETYKPTRRIGKTSTTIRDTIVYGISVVNIFTGKSYIFQHETTFYMNTTTFDELERYISVYSPSEVIMITPFNDDDLNKIIQYSGIRTNTIHKINSSDKTNLKVSRCMEQRYIKQLLTTFFKEETYDLCSEFQTDMLSTQSFCYLLDFIQQHNVELVRKISIPDFNNTTDRVVLANHTLKQLNIIDDNIMESTQYGRLSSVLTMLNKCSTSMGKRKFQYQLTNPVFDTNWLNNEYVMTEMLLSDDYYHFVETFRKQLKNVRDMEKICRQLVVKKIYPVSIYHLYSSVNIIQQINVCMAETHEFGRYLTNGLHSNDIGSNQFIESETETIIQFLNKHFVLENCKNISSMTTFPENIIRSGVSNELDSLINEYTETKRVFDTTKQYLNMIMQKYEKGDTDYIRVHETEKSGAFLQITTKRSHLLKANMEKYESDINSNATILPPIYSKDIKFVKSTASNVTIESSTLNSIIKKIFVYKDEINKMISCVYLQVISSLVETHFQTLERLSEFTSKLDVILCKAFIAREYNYCKPVINENAERSFVDVVDMRHCLIEHIQQNELYVTNSISLGTYDKSKDTDQQNGILLYGTNAVGKTSFIRALGISIIMAQSGLYVPCSSFQYKPYTALFSRILGNDNIFKGLSTFAVEMSELRVILKMADENSLVLGDELCSGTEIESALSIFVSGLTQLHTKNSSFIFATHFHEIVDFEEISLLTQMSCYHMAVTFDREADILIYDRKLRRGSGPRTYGLEVCKSLYLEDDFMEEAYKIRNKYFPNSRGELSNDKTRYNSKKIRGKCEICNLKLGDEIHHINHQKDADKNGFIGSFHKNHPANLMSICEKCHDNIHINENESLIRKKTTNGYTV